MIPPMTLSQYLAIGKLVGILAAVAIICWQSSQIHKWHQQSDHCADARRLDRQSYETAQNDAAAKNREQVAAVEQQYKRNSDNEKDAYLRDLAELRRLRSQAPAAPGAAGTTRP